MRMIEVLVVLLIVLNPAYTSEQMEGVSPASQSASYLVAPVAQALLEYRLLKHWVPRMLPPLRATSKISSC